MYIYIYIYIFIALEGSHLLVDVSLHPPQDWRQAPVDKVSELPDLTPQALQLALVFISINIDINMHIISAIIIMIYIYIYTYLVRHGNVLVFLFVYGFHRRDSRGPVAAGNHNKNQRRKPYKKRSLPRRKP